MSSSPMPSRRFLSLAIDVAGLHCLVVGGGRVAARKVRTLLAAGARVTVVAPALGDEVRQAVQRSEVRWIEARYDTSQLDGVCFVVAATSDLETNLRVGREAEQRGLWCCLAAPGDRSRVIFPAVLEDDEVTIAVHSDGRDCRRSQAVRDELARQRQPDRQQQQESQQQQ